MAGNDPQLANTNPPQPTPPMMGNPNLPSNRGPVGPPPIKKFTPPPMGNMGVMPSQLPVQQQVQPVTPPPSS